MELTIQQLLHQGIEAQKEGKVQDAERLYRLILKSQPLHPHANHNLGVIAASVGRTNLALPLFKTALEINPKIEQFWISYVDILIKLKQLFYLMEGAYGYKRVPFRISIFKVTINSFDTKIDCSFYIGLDAIANHN